MCYNIREWQYNDIYIKIHFFNDTLHLVIPNVQMHADHVHWELHCKVKPLSHMHCTPEFN